MSLSEKLKPCPFCGGEMLGAWDRKIQSWVRGDSGFEFAHPKNDCVFSEFEFPEADRDRWNRRPNLDS